MKPLVAFPLLLLFVATRALESDVVTLTAANFEEEVAKHDVLMVEFYAPWCGHCKDLAPKYSAAAARLQEHGLSLAKVDATEESKLAEKYGISGYPTIKVFKNKGAKVEDYDGARSAQAIVKYMTAAKGGPVDNAEDLVDDEGYGDEEPPRPYDDDEDYGGDNKNYNNPEPVGTVSLDKHTFPKLVGSGKFDVLVKFDTSYAYGEKEEQFAKFTERLATVRHAENFLIGVVGVEDYGAKKNDDLRERFGLKTEDFPAYKLFKSNSAEPISFTGPIEADSLARFVAQNVGLWIGLDGTLEQYDKLVQGFLSLAAEDQKKRLSQAETELGALTDDDDKVAAAYYIHAINKILAKGNGYVATEKSRLEKLTTSKVSDAKKAEIKKKLNILVSFTE
eukprot:TRINITY_DN3616_c0_g1_i1.p2 TRINITY_DN3616_c0_g1~~TRINITY_DN3616_c0_g1_i1.p2  ORF type:complete len:392 (-),score=102.21 TRINITY_DN3616_c0_g1_i1:12-1187(-)